MEIGVLKSIQESEWAFPSFVISRKSKGPGKPGTVRFLSDLCELNKRVVYKQYPSAKTKSTFAIDKIEYLGYILACAGIKPQVENLGNWW